VELPMASRFTETGLSLSNWIETKLIYE